MGPLPFLAAVLFGASLQDEDWSKVPPPGKLIDVGGHRLHMLVAGRGGPTVVMEYGAGATSLDWTLVQPEIARFARVVTYDRAGYAWSDPGPMPRSMRQIAYELHTGLRKAGVKPPYVMVGHSLGGPMVRVFASMYPKDVAGMVLLDTTDADTVLGINGKNVRFRTLTQGRPIPAVQERYTPKAKEAAAKIEPFQPEVPFDKLPERLQRLRFWLRQQPAFYEAGDSEFDYLPEELTSLYEDQQKNRYPLGDIPLVVVAGTKKDDPTPGVPVDPEWAKIVQEKIEQKRRQATLSRNGKFVSADRSGHEIHLFQPEIAVSAIRDVVERVRKSPITKHGGP